jgi:hypothetical protein
VNQAQQALDLVSEARDAAPSAPGSPGRHGARLLVRRGVRAARERAVAALHELVTRPNLTDNLLPL